MTPMSFYTLWNFPFRMNLVTIIYRSISTNLVFEDIANTHFYIIHF